MIGYELLGHRLERVPVESLSLTALLGISLLRGHPLAKSLMIVSAWPRASRSESFG